MALAAATYANAVTLAEYAKGLEEGSMERVFVETFTKTSDLLAAMPIRLRPFYCARAGPLPKSFSATQRMVRIRTPRASSVRVSFLRRRGVGREWPCAETNRACARMLGELASRSGLRAA